jgi:ferredoxin-NADP reductase
MVILRKNCSLQYHELIISKVTEVVKGFYTFSFEEGHGLKYEAGQYLTFIRDLGHGEVRRSYSLYSSPLLHEPLSIGVRRIENGSFSRWLADRARPGDRLLTTGAGGFFVLPKAEGPFQLFFLAAGSGITPVLSLIKTALHGHSQIEIVLVYSNHSRSQAIFLKELQDLAALFPGRFHAEFLFSDHPLLMEARLNRDLLIRLLDQLASDKKGPVYYYICGPEPYMRFCTYTLQEEGVSPERIRKENFVIRKDPVRPVHPPDKNKHGIVVRTDGKTFSFTQEYPQTILAAAKANGVSMPYSCETGRCGSCAARCVKGNVWHSYNEVLTDTELKAGIVLTCTGYAVGGDLELEI